MTNLRPPHENPQDSTQSPEANSLLITGLPPSELQKLQRQAELNGATTRLNIGGVAVSAIYNAPENSRIADKLMNQDQFEGARQLHELPFTPRAWGVLLDMGEYSPIQLPDGRESTPYLSMNRLSALLRAGYIDREVKLKQAGLGGRGLQGLNALEDYFSDPAEVLPQPLPLEYSEALGGKAVFQPEALAAFSQELGVRMTDESAQRLIDNLAEKILRYHPAVKILPSTQPYTIQGISVTLDHSKPYGQEIRLQAMSLDTAYNIFHDFSHTNEIGSPAYHYAALKYLKALKAAGYEYSAELPDDIPEHPSIGEHFRPAQMSAAEAADLEATELLPLSTNGWDYNDFLQGTINYLNSTCAKGAIDGIYYPLSSLFYEVVAPDNSESEYRVSASKLTAFLKDSFENNQLDPDTTLISHKVLCQLLYVDAQHGAHEDLPVAKLPTKFPEKGLLSIMRIEKNPTPTIDLDQLMHFAQAYQSHDITAVYDKILTKVQSFTNKSALTVIEETLCRGLLLDGPVASEGRLKDLYILSRYLKALRQQADSLRTE